MIMKQLVYSEIICQDDKWFLRYTSGGEVKEQIQLPNVPMMNRIWETCSDLLEVYVSDYGGNQYNHEPLRRAARAFAGISELLSDEANQQELDMLYEYDENEKWYQKC